MPQTRCSVTVNKAFSVYTEKGREIIRNLYQNTTLFVMRKLVVMLIRQYH